jgi:hypothetical protein
MKKILVLLLASSSILAEAGTCGFDEVLANAPDNASATGTVEARASTEFNRLFPATVTPADLMVTKTNFLNYTGIPADIGAFIEKNNVNFATTLIDLSATTNKNALSGLSTDFNSRRNGCIYPNKPCNGYFDYANVKTALSNLKAIEPNVYNTFACSNDGTNGDLDNIREVSAFLANIAQETNGGTPPTKVGLAWGLSKVEETPLEQDDENNSTNIAGKLCNPNGTGRNPAKLCASKTISTEYCTLYTNFCAQYNPQGLSPVPSSMWYYGRGPKQLTSFGNYLVYGSYINKTDPLEIAKTPQLLVTNPVKGWETAIAYYMKPYLEETTNAENKINAVTKPSMHEVMDKGLFMEVDNKPGIGNKGQHGEYGFGQTINKINGGLECKSSINTQSLNRINFYLESLIRLGAKFDHAEVKLANGTVENITFAQMKTNVKTPLKFIKSGGWEGYYNTAPLPLKYYDFAGKPANTVEKIVLYYDATGANTERLDCIGYGNWI